MSRIRSLGKPAFDSVRPIDYAALQRWGDGDERRAIGSYTKTGYVQRISPQLIRWARHFWAQIAPHTDGFYTNDAIEESQQQIDENYLGNYPRLVRLKNPHDPTNLFRLNANVPPSE